MIISESSLNINANLEDRNLNHRLATANNIMAIIRTCQRLQRCPPLRCARYVQSQHHRAYNWKLC